MIHKNDIKHFGIHVYMYFHGVLEILINYLNTC